MASASYTEDLTCSICLTLFTDPVSLLCGHSFCRKCITICLSAQDQCPQCRTTVPTEEKYFPTTNHILKSLVEKAKEAEKIKKEPGNEKTEVAECLCPEHEEKFKLFCETEQQLACVVCRDGERHDGHKFKPIKEAATSRRRELEKGMENLSADIRAIESLANTQREEITKTQETSRQLMSQISAQFEEMHQFLRKREDEIKKELQEKEREAVEKISENLNIIDTALSERRELEVKATSVLEIQDSERFLQSWTEDNTMMTRERLFRPRADDLQVAYSSLCLGPYESHLQFFVWKEMLQVIKPRAELLSLNRDNTGVTVSDDGRSLFCKSKSIQSQPGFSFHSTQATGSPSFGTGFGSAHTTGSSSFGMGFGSTDTTGSSSFGTGFGSTQATGSSSFGTGFGSTQATGSSSFGTGFGSTQATGSSSFGTGFGSTQATGSSSFGTGFGSTQATGSSSFGTGFSFSKCSNAPAFGMSHTDSRQYNDSSFGKFDNRKTNHAFSFQRFTSGQHYWEIDVGKRDYWELGVKDHFLKYESQKYVVSSQSSVTELTFTGRPRKIGIYLNCSSEELSFYDADNMKHVHTMSPRFMSMPVSAHFNVGYSEAADPNPLTVCWY
ncbi:nuclear factor 7, ovary-like isoform X1 [Centroberyx affinis]|uniref:nuclear factor 7, ovary-like isoform X1 n=1 Tax=Centroberyx affinis TaxID=166261 RepID=UPI003A5C5A45